MKRRDFIFAAGAGSVAPLLRPFASTAFGQAGGAPVRIVFVYSPNGSVKRSFQPPADNLAGSPILAPFAPHKTDMVVIRGLGYSGYNTPHSMGTMKALASAPLPACGERPPA